MDKHKLDQLFSNGKLSPMRCTTKWLISHGIYQDIFDSTSFLDESITIGFRINCILNDVSEHPKCSVCLTKLVLVHHNQFSSVCSRICADKNLNPRNKRKKTCLEKYGSESFTQSDLFKVKAKKTCLERYGVENPGSSKEIKEKIKATNIERYGAENVFQSEEIREQSKQTMLERYGVEHAILSPEISKKRNLSNLQKYGVDHTFQSEEMKTKSKQTCLEKYGVENISQTKTLFEDHRVSEMVAVGKSALQIAEELNVSYSTIIKFINRSNIEYNRCKTRSAAEDEVAAFCKQFVDVKTSDRILITPKELDIYIPSKNLAVEFNGVYWHSTNRGVEQDYHLNKTLECEKLGVQLIHIFQQDWEFKQEIVKSIIGSKLGINKKIPARKTIVKQISSKDSKEFLNRCHIQGFIGAKIHLGLFHDNQLVAVMNFGGSRFNKNYEWELLRYSSELNTNIVGGASKLFKKFVNLHSPKSVISYCDRGRGNGNLYEKLGFIQEGFSEPSFFYVKGSNILSRYQCQKHKLPDLLKNFNPDNSALTNMQNHGWMQIYDCGTSRWVFEK